MNITLTTYKGAFTVAAKSVVGQWAVHRNPDVDHPVGWVISHTGCGLRAAHVAELQQARHLLKALEPLQLSNKHCTEVVRHARALASGSRSKLKKKTFMACEVVRAALVAAGYDPRREWVNV